MKTQNFLYSQAVRSISIFLFIALLFVQCSKDNDPPEEINEEEAITRVTLAITGADGTSNSYTWNEGEAVPTLNLTANTTHQVSIFFYDATDPADVEDITEEVIEEADEHFILYEVSSASLTITSATNDTVDSNQVSINLKTQWAAGDAGSGVVRAYLIHEPTSKTGSTRSALGGSTDVELDFPVSIQ
jgi:PBP1b-binding outer membrane lipoprotein LpoB